MTNKSNFIPPLTRAKYELYDHDIPNSWRYALFGLLLEHDRLERQKWSRWFLLKCKELKVIPHFIQNITSNIANATSSGETSFRKLTQSFHHKVLMQRIRDVHRQIATTLNTIEHRLQATRYINQPTLDYYLERYTYQIRNYYTKYKQPKLQCKLDVLKLNNIPAKNYTNINKSAANRVTTINTEITPVQRDILSLGPNFAVKETRKKEDILKSVEKGCERFNYGYRYQHTRNNTNQEDNSPTLRFPDSNNVYKPPAPQLHSIHENRLRVTKNSIMSICKEALDKPQTSISNLTKQQRVELNDLRNNSSIIVKQSDKDKQLVVADKETYKNMCIDHLSDEITYTQIKRNPIHKMEEAVGAITTHLEVLNPDLAEKLTPHCPRIPEFYGTFKTHKNIDPPPLRPVVSGCDGPTEKLAHLCNAILKQAVTLIPTNIISTDMFMKRIENKFKHKLTDRHILFSADIKSLYTSIPLKHCLKVTVDFVHNHKDSINMFDLSLGEFELILSAMLSVGYFRFDNMFFQQKKGLAMGSRPAPPLAILYVYLTVELPLLENDFTYAIKYIPKPLNLPDILYWDRYVDDVFSILEGTLADVEKIMNYTNKLNPDIQFTYETGPTIPYLDVTVSIDHHNKSPIFDLYIKPSNLGIFLNYRSHHPRSILHNTAKNEFRRAHNRCSNDHLRDKAYHRISQMLIQNEYPKNVVDKLLQDFKNESLTKHNKITPKSYLCLPFISEQCSRKVYTYLRKEGLINDVRVIFKPGKTLKEKLVTTKIIPTKCNKQNIDTCNICQQHGGESPICMTKNVVYQLNCTLCSGQYIGETCRHLRERTREHYRDISNNKGAMGGHYSKEHSTQQIPKLPFTTKIVKPCKDWVERKICEAIEIKHINPTINTQHNKNNRRKKEYDEDTWTLL